MPVRREPPAVVAALDLASVEISGRQGHAAMRADVAQGEDGTLALAPEQDRLPQHRAPGQLAPPPPPAPRARRSRRVGLPRDIARAVIRRNGGAPSEGYPPAAAPAIFAADHSHPP